ncbi:MAG: MBL fold metallo-hydrolase [Hymenobacteraceae bacterium]|nr:MBL fold metallo-hydrolase [Hymenobacteraceae bacterium]MDX5482314.1 MBL fold metallo-hydrolase [Hymenobacteraceae bacterium]
MKHFIAFLFLLLNGNLLLAQHYAPAEALAIACGSFGKTVAYASVDHGLGKPNGRDRYLKAENGKNRMFVSRAAFLLYMLEQDWAFVSTANETADNSWSDSLLFRRRIQPKSDDSSIFKNTTDTTHKTIPMHPMINFTWVGGPTFLLQIGSFRLLSDPMLAEGPVAFYMNGHPATGEDNAPITRAAPLPAIDLQPLDLVLISHLHSDHFDRVAQEKLLKEVALVAPADQIDSPKLQAFKNREPLGWWQEKVLERNGEVLRLVALPANHSHDQVTNKDLGVVNGYALQYSKGSDAYTIYWTGDTVWFDEIKEIKERLGRIDLLVPHMGAVGKNGPWGLMTLDSEEAVKVMEAVQPGLVIPVHHHTFSHYTEPISLLQKKLANRPGVLRVLQEGQTTALQAHTNQ